MSSDGKSDEPVIPQTPPDPRIDEFRKHVDHMKVHAAMERTKLSVTVTELVKYVKENQPDDPLATGATPKNNPYAQKSKCIAL